MSQTFLLLLCLSGSVYLLPVKDENLEDTCGYESCYPTSTQDGFLNVHIVPHTHDDVGWLKTVDQYYYGSRNNIQKAGVQYILDSVIKELWEDPKRRFIYVETAFFWKWWVHQTEEVQQRVHSLVRSGRLQMVGGAWSMNDEAASHYQSTVDQFTWGLSKLNQTFGTCGRPRVGWQIDPFGHSREFASLLAMMGYDGLFLGRIDYQDKANRLRHKTMEMVWRGDDNLGKASDIFTGILHNTYSPPPGFCFDVLCSDEPIIDDPDSPMYNVESKICIEVIPRSWRGTASKYLDLNTNQCHGTFPIEVFLDTVRKQALYYRTNNVILTMGGDFTYQDAHMWYVNLDKLIIYTNLKSAKEGYNITLFYSTPDCYLKAVKDANPTLPTKQDDFFPYASDQTAYWTGYFTSRPTTKYFEREGNNYLQMVKQLQVLADLEKHNQFVLNELKSAMVLPRPRPVKPGRNVRKIKLQGVMQHHDAITGTEKQHVTHDYERLLNLAIDDAMIIAKQAFSKMTQRDATKPPLFDFQRCHLNESRCEVSETSEKFVVTIYNPLGWSVREPIRIPVPQGTYEVRGPNGKQIQIQIVDIPNRVSSIPTRTSKATHEIVFITNLKPISYKSFYIKKIIRNKRSTESKNNYDIYNINMNEYRDELKELIINRLEPKDTFNDNKDTINNKGNIKVNKDKENVPLAPIYSPEIEPFKDADLDLLKDGLNDKNLYELEKFLRQPKHIGKVRVHKYPGLNEEELRMLSDEPRTVEKFDEEVVLENQFFKLNVDTASGLIKQVTFPNHSTLNLTVNMYYYFGSCGDNEDTARRSSGAYIFRPVDTEPTKLTTLNTEVVKGEIVKEFRVNLSPNGYINTKLYNNLNFIETEWVVGPISIADDMGKEYVIKYETNILNNGEFFTDSNGRQMLKRKLNYRPQWNVTLQEPVAGNYFPVTNEIYIENDDYRVSVLTDRSEGGTSLVEGDIELMLHRRLLCDDAFGVGEALNETAKDIGLVVRGKHRIVINKDREVIKKNVLGLHLSPHVLFSDTSDMKYDEWLKLNNEYSWVDQELPKGLHLLTLEPWDSKLLIRIENYLEEEKNSDVQIDLRTIFRNIEIKSFRETMLAANMWVDEYEKWSWKTENKMPNVGENITENDDFKITLKAKQIRTFIVEYNVKS